MINVITAPEIEILIIASEKKYDEYWLLFTADIREVFYVSAAKRKSHKTRVSGAE